MRNMRTWLKAAAAVSMAAITFTASLGTPVASQTVFAAKKTTTPYCKKLNLNLKSGKTIRNTATATYWDEALMPKKQKVKVKQTIKTSTKSSGRNYKTTFNVTWDYKGDPKITNKTVDKDDWSSILPIDYWNAIDYRTGKVDQIKDVSYSKPKWKTTYYKKQNWKYTKKIAKAWGIKGSDNQNVKKETLSFTVTYPKTQKNLIIAIGTIDLYCESGHITYDDYLYGEFSKFDEGKETWDKTIGYKSGKNFVYIRLNK